MLTGENVTCNSLILVSKLFLTKLSLLTPCFVMNHTSLNITIYSANSADSTINNKVDMKREYESEKDSHPLPLKMERGRIRYIESLYIVRSTNIERCKRMH